MYGNFSTRQRDSNKATTGKARPRIEGLTVLVSIRIRRVLLGLVLLPTMGEIGEAVIEGRFRKRRSPVPTGEDGILERRATTGGLKITLKGQTVEAIT